MEGLRGVAVLLVFVVHYCSLIDPWIAASDIAALARPLHRLGLLGVDLFFVLSGFLIYGSLIRKPRPFLPFIWRRIVRLYPAFLAMLALYCLLSLLLPSLSKFPPAPLDAAVYLLQNLLLLPGMVAIAPIITVAWSLSYEMFFYLSIPGLVAVLAARRWPWWLRCLVFAATIPVWLLGGLPYPQMMMFLAGMILADLLPHLGPRAGLVWLDRAVLLALALLLALIWRDGYSAPARIGLCAGLIALGLGAFSHRGRLFALLVPWPLRWLGNMSYSYYLSHGLALNALFFVLPVVIRPDGSDGALFWLLVAPALLVTVIVALPLYLWIERPYSILAKENPAIVTSLDGAGCDPEVVRSGEGRPAG